MLNDGHSSARAADKAALNNLNTYTILNICHFSQENY